jgi:hypothetical protein
MTKETKPALIGGREKVARIIEPSAFEDETPHHQRVYRNMSLAEARADALAKADAIAALSSAKPGTVQEHEPVAWRYELATALMTDGTYSNWKQCLTEHKPNVPADSIRNLTPLYAAQEHGPAQGLGDQGAAEDLGRLLRAIDKLAPFVRAPLVRSIAGLHAGTDKLKTVPAHRWKSFTDTVTKVKARTKPATPEPTPTEDGERLREALGELIRLRGRLAKADRVIHWARASWWVDRPRRKEILRETWADLVAYEAEAEAEAATPEPSVSEAQFTPEDLYWLASQKERGHCGESASDVIARQRRNERIDRMLAALGSPPALPSGPAQGLGDTLSPREAQLFDAAWHLVAAVNGGGPLPHKTVAERAQEATAVLLPLLDARNAPANPAAPEPSSTDTENAPKPGELRLFGGQLCRFIERELEGDKWEVIGLFPAPGSNTPAGEVCEGCGGSWSDEALKAAGHVSCCPERKMIAAGEGEKLREALRTTCGNRSPLTGECVLGCGSWADCKSAPDQPSVVPGGEGER